MALGQARLRAHLDNLSEVGLLVFHNEEDMLKSSCIFGSPLWNNYLEKLWNEHRHTVGANFVSSSYQLDLSDHFDAIVLEFVEVRYQLDGDVPLGLLTEALIDLSEASLANFVDNVVFHQNIDPFVTEAILLLTFLSDRSLKLNIVLAGWVRNRSLLIT